MAENTGRSWIKENAATMALDLDFSGASRGAGARADRLGPREAFLVAYDRLSLLAEVAGSGAGSQAIVVAAVDGCARVVEALVLRDRTALVIGRHTRCGLRLAEESVALRQLAALARFEEGRPVLHLWDLRTQQPFVTEDQQPSSAVVAEGPLYVAVGGYALWFIPAGLLHAGRAATAAEAFRALPPRTFVDRRPPIVDRARLRRPPPAVAGVSALRTIQPAPIPLPFSVPASRKALSQVTHMAPPLLMGEGDEPEVGWGTLRLAGPGHRERCAVSAERLEQGVLIGRYERCGLAVDADQGNRVSRVHLLVARLGAEVWAIDTASTNGVRRGNQPLAAGVLRDADSLGLADMVLDWRRHEHADA